MLSVFVSVQTVSGLACGHRVHACLVLPHGVNRTSSTKVQVLYHPSGQFLFSKRIVTISSR